MTALPLPLHALGGGRQHHTGDQPSHQSQQTAPSGQAAATSATTTTTSDTTTAAMANTTSATTTAPVATTTAPAVATTTTAAPAPTATAANPTTAGAQGANGTAPRRPPSGQSGSGKDLVLHVRSPRHVAHVARDPGDTISDFKFSPATITVRVGDTITWTNDGPTAHTATANDHSFDTGTLQKGQSASHTFTQAGTFAYICTIHPFMHGTVVVEASSSSTTPSGTAGGSSGSTGSSGSSGSTGASSASTPTTTATSTTPSLPSTGTNLLSTLLVAALLIGAGFVLRRHLIGRTPGS